MINTEYSTHTLNSVGTCTNNIWLLADLHFGAHVNSTLWLDIQSRYYTQCLIPMAARDMQPGDAFVILGDVFENKHFLNVNVMECARNVIRLMSQVMPVYILMGNHDCYYIDQSTINSISQFEDIPNVKVISKDAERIKVAGMNCVFVPWSSDSYSVEKKAIDLERGADLCFLHQDIESFIMDNGRLITSGVRTELLSSYKSIYSGHIHKSQRKGNVRYVGSPYQLSKGEIGQAKGFYKVRLVGGELEEVFVENDYSPKYKTLDAVEFFSMSIDEARRFFANSFVDVRMESDLSRNVDLKRILDFMSTYGISYYALSFPPYSKKTLSVESSGSAIMESMELKEMVAEYYKKNSANKTEYDRQMEYYYELESKWQEQQSEKYK